MKKALSEVSRSKFRKENSIRSSFVCCSVR